MGQLRTHIESLGEWDICNSKCEICSTFVRIVPLTPWVRVCFGPKECLFLSSFSSMQDTSAPVSTKACTIIPSIRINVNSSFLSFSFQ